MKRLYSLVLLLSFLLLCTAARAEPLHYETFGEKRGESEALPLVLIHGWACNTSFWEGQEPLAQERPLYLVDLPGHGETPAAAAPCEQQAMAQALAATLDQAGVKRAFIGGHSMGAAVARWFAHLHPERSAGLILVDGAIMPYPDTAGARAMWQRNMTGFYEAMASGDEQFMAGFIDSMQGENTPSELKEQVRERMLATPREVRLECMRHFVQPESWKLPAVTTPTLGIYAATKDLPPNYEELLRKMFPNLEYHLWQGAGHFLHMERPEDVNALMETFMEQVAAEG